MNYYEEIKRKYNNGVAITYENLDEESLYIHSIESSFKRNGYATESLNNFIKEHKEKNIYLYSSDELGTDKQILDDWYETLGFKKCNSLDSIPYYNATHVIKNKELRCNE